MKFLRSSLVCLLFASVVSISSRAAAADEYLFDLLAKPEYYKSWNTLILGEKNVDTWLAKYAKTKNGPAAPGETIKLGSGSYQLNTVCKTHDCGNNMFYVLFAPNRTKAWGLLLKDRTNERFFGNPDDEKKLLYEPRQKGNLSMPNNPPKPTPTRTVFSSKAAAARFSFTFGTYRKG